MTASESSTPLDPWKIDVLTAALGSIAVNGPACGLMIFEAHHRLREKPAPQGTRQAEIIGITPTRAKPRLVSSNPPAFNAVARGVSL